MSASEGARWLEKAEEHLRLAKLALEKGIYSLSCFHSQQAAEGALRGVLVAFARVHLLTHSLSRLAEEAKSLKGLRLPPPRMRSRSSRTTTFKPDIRTRGSANTIEGRRRGHTRSRRGSSMSVVSSLRRIDAESKRAYEELVESLRGRKVALLLFGSRAGGGGTLLSDYDLLAIYGDAPIEGRGLIVNVFNVSASELEGRLSSPIIVSALLGGEIVLDNLGISQRLKELKVELERRGAKLEGDRIVLPKPV
ncbi:MAG: HEPN domain-containing protein [Candidatus Bathyarchaeia archaeon]